MREQKFQELLALSGNLLLKWDTGTGKTFASLRLCVAKKVLVVVSRTVHIDNWKAEVAKWGVPVTLVHYVTWKSLDITSLDFYQVIILDECHHITERTLEPLKSFNGRVIGLSATIKPEKEALLNQLSMTTHTFTLGESDIPRPVFHLVKIELVGKGDFKIVRKRKEVVADFEWKTVNLSEWKKDTKRYANNHLTVTCSAVDRLGYELDRLKTLGRRVGKQSEGFTLTQLKRQGLVLKTFFADKKLPELTVRLRTTKNRCLVYLTTIEQTETFRDWSGVSIVHSKMTKKAILETLSQFELGITHILINVDCLTEGMNIPKVNEIHILQLETSKTSTKFVQQVGRGLRGSQTAIFVYVLNVQKDLETTNKNLNTFAEHLKS